MRIALLIYGSLETVSGGYLYDRKLVEHLVKQGDQVEIISLPWRNYARHLIDNCSPVLLDRLARVRADILIQDELNHPSLFALNHRLKKRSKIPVVAIVHHLRSSELRPAWQNWFYRQIEQRYLKSVDGFIFNSQGTRDTVWELLPIAYDERELPHIIAYPAGDRFGIKVNALEAAHRADQAGPLRVVFLGNLIPRKGLETLLNAVAQTSPGTCILDVTGSPSTDPAYAREMHQLTARLDISSRVKFQGALPDQDLEKLLSGSHLLVVPSFYEGFGIVYLEGMGFGLPAVGTSAGAAREIITHGRDGFLISPGDAANLAKILQTLSTDRARLRVLSLSALERYQAHPTWNESAAQIRSFLCAMIQ